MRYVLLKGSCLLLNHMLQPFSLCVFVSVVFFCRMGKLKLPLLFLQFVPFVIAFFLSHKLKGEFTHEQPSAII